MSAVSLRDAHLFSAASPSRGLVSLWPVQLRSRRGARLWMEARAWSGGAQCRRVFVRAFAVFSPRCCVCDLPLPDFNPIPSRRGVNEREQLVNDWMAGKEAGTGGTVTVLCVQQPRGDRAASPRRSGRAGALWRAVLFAQFLCLQEPIPVNARAPTFTASTGIDKNFPLLVTYTPIQGNRFYCQ